ncbi:MAG: FadR/GntR family transcriptional regulator [Propionibacteriaceae bacterium]|nr:FadR/GntR family transcriptional regulator [Propionibacteriaceae bacterium]
MPRARLADEAMDAILNRIVDDTWPPGCALPPETELAAILQVSRPTMREAVRALGERGVLRVVHGRGTYVADVASWTDLPTMIDVLARTTPPRQLGEHLTQLRRMIEVGAAGLAASHRTKEDIEHLTHVLTDYDDASQAGDIDAIVQRDLDFHRQILVASGNPLLAPVMSALDHAARRSRRITSEQSEVRARARGHHRAILKAISDGDPTRAKDAMRAHMTQTAEDLARFTD